MKKKNLGLALLFGAMVVVAGCATEQPAPAPAPAPTAKPATPPAATAPAPAAPAPAPAVKLPPAPTAILYFDLDSSTINAANRSVVEQHAKYLNDNATARVFLEGHADERGSREYNLALGERRAESVEKQLLALGVPANRVSTVSFGEERPAVQGTGESAWSKNRRVEFKY